MIIVDVPRPEKCRGCRFMCLKPIGLPYTLPTDFMRRQDAAYACVLEDEEQQHFHSFVREKEIPDTRPDYCPVMIGIAGTMAEQFRRACKNAEDEYGKGKVDYFEIGYKEDFLT
ncbi:MAG: hypothetical protein IJK01_08565 [Clostridia bacterium]|nr:hypothetical protein [Clostridia bacterium]